MPTLVIHAPRTMAQSQNKRSFQQTVQTGVGDGYAITQKERALITSGWDVVVLDKDSRNRAEGKLVRLDPNGWTKSGIQRYDVHIARLTSVPYQPEALNRRGVAIL